MSVFAALHRFDTVSKLVVLPVHQARFIFTSLALDVEVHDGGKNYRTRFGYSLD